MTMRSTRQIEYGDFQTPLPLAQQVVAFLHENGIHPLSIVEPTCGTGSFLLAALRGLPFVQQALGVEINSQYLEEARHSVFREPNRPATNLRLADFFDLDWRRELAALPEPILVLGNPPWVTASGMGTIGGTNLPEKTNFQKRSGMDALTGKSNFDIAEWILVHMIKWLTGRQATLAMLVKTHVARRALRHLWSSKAPLVHARILNIDAKKYFDVCADACLLICELGTSPGRPECLVADLDRPQHICHTIAMRDGYLVSDADTYDRLSYLLTSVAEQAEIRWRSGIKHDCAKVMELVLENGRLINGYGEYVDVEQQYLYPLLKGSDIARGGSSRRERYMIVPQREPGEDTSLIEKTAPKTWAYLNRYADQLGRRASSIYRNRPRFSVFGVGPYTFSPWKVAICGLYKHFDFAIVGPRGERPVVFDDTVYHLSFEDEAEASFVVEMLNSHECQKLLESLVFWDSKRPVTIDLLRRIDIHRLATHVGNRLTPQPKLCQLMPTLF